MARTAFQSVDEYIASQPEAAQDVLGRVRGTICKALPGAERTIWYNIPTYKLHGDAVLYLAGWSSTTRSTPPQRLSPPRSGTS